MKTVQPRPLRKPPSKSCKSDDLRYLYSEEAMLLLHVVSWSKMVVSMIGLQVKHLCCF